VARYFDGTARMYCSLAGFFLTFFLAAEVSVS
jgi:hypothetical protein